ncbi:hypothetical protein FKM82_004888 [Ascaphus truei]
MLLLGRKVKYLLRREVPANPRDTSDCYIWVTLCTRTRKWYSHAGIPSPSQRAGSISLNTAFLPGASPIGEAEPLMPTGLLTSYVYSPTKLTKKRAVCVTQAVKWCYGPRCINCPHKKKW